MPGSPLRATRWCLLAVVLTASGGCAAVAIPTGPGSLAARREVNAARLITREVDAAVSANRLKRLQDSFECDGGAVNMQATLFTDASGTPRKYVLEGGTGDSAHFVFYYYDTAGRLRLIDSDQRSSNNSQRTSHVYYDPTGKIVHSDERKSGPAGTFSATTERRDPKGDLRELGKGCRRVPYRETSALKPSRPAPE